MVIAAGKSQVISDQFCVQSERMVQQSREKRKGVILLFHSKDLTGDACHDLCSTEKNHRWPQTSFCLPLLSSSAT
jgi:hypothetical protein